MKKDSIKSHLKAYKIVQKRSTTIHHAFASAIAPFDVYEDLKSKLDAALRLLNQNPDEDLKCVYCEAKAETWDHLIGLVEEKKLRGFGHQLGNLVPCCKNCNSKKSSKDWKEFLKTEAHEGVFDERARRIDCYLERYAAEVDLKRLEDALPNEWLRYGEIKDEILKLMEEADGIAKKIREAVISKAR